MKLFLATVLSVLVSHAVTADSVYQGWKTPTSSPSPTPTPVPSPSPTPTPVPSPSPTPTPVPSPSPTPTPVPSPSPTPTPVPSPSPTPTPVPSPSPTPTPVPSPSPTPTPVPSPSPTPTPVPSPSPTPTPVPSPSSTPTPSGPCASLDPVENPDAFTLVHDCFQNGDCSKAFACKADPRVVKYVPCLPQQCPGRLVCQAKEAADFANCHDLTHKTHLLSMYDVVDLTCATEHIFQCFDIVTNAFVLNSLCNECKNVPVPCPKQLCAQQTPAPSGSATTPGVTTKVPTTPAPTDAPTTASPTDSPTIEPKPYPSHIPVEPQRATGTSGAARLQFGAAAVLALPVLFLLR